MSVTNVNRDIENLLWKDIYEKFYNNELSREKRKTTRNMVASKCKMCRIRNSNCEYNFICPTETPYQFLQAFNSPFVDQIHDHEWYFLFRRLVWKAQNSLNSASSQRPQSGRRERVTNFSCPVYWLRGGLGCKGVLARIAPLSWQAGQASPHV